MTYQCNDDLLQLLNELRANQKTFFKSAPGSTARQNALEKSKALEHELDKFLAARNPQVAPPDLFTQTPAT